MLSVIKKLNQKLTQHELLLLLLVFTIILRFPSLSEPFWYGDENIYLAIGQGMRHGLVLYKDIIDYPNKPPLIYLLAATTQTVTAFRFVLLLWHLLTVTFFHTLAARFSQNKLTTVISTIIFIFATSTPYFEGNIANSEIFFIMPVLAALIFLTAKLRHIKTFKTKKLRYHLFAGILLGFAFLFKIHVALDIAAFGFYFYFLDKKISQKLPLQIIKAQFLWVFVLGVSLPIILTLVIWSFQGVSPLTLFLSAAGSSGYVSVWGGQELLLQTIGLGSLQSRAILLGVITLLIWIFRSRFQFLTNLVVIWTLFTLFAALLSARNYPHYLIQVIPPTVLGLTLLVSVRKIRDSSVLIVSLLLVLAAFFRFNFYHYPVVSYYQNYFSFISGRIDQTEYYRRFDSRMPRNYALAQYIRQHTSPDDLIYIWGTEPGVYVLAQRLQVEKLVVSFHVADLDYYDETLATLQKVKPAIVVVMESESRNFPGLKQFLHDHYTLIYQIGDPGKAVKDNIGSRALIYQHLLR